MSNKPGRPKGGAMERHQLRMPKELMDRLRWRAQEKASTLPETIRKILNDATKDQKPPDRVNERIIAATDEQWSAWRDAAAQLGMSLDELLKTTMDGVTRKVFRP